MIIDKSHGDWTVGDLHADQLASRIDRIAARLRSLAEAADRAAERARNLDTPSRIAHPATGIAEGLASEITWGIANAGIPLLFETAAAADEHYAKERAAADPGDTERTSNGHQRR